MTLKILFSARDGLWDDYEAHLAEALAEKSLQAEVVLEADPDEVDYIVFAPNGPVSDFTSYTNTKAVLGLWAGVEDIVTNATLTQPLTRMVDPGLAQGMAEWVCGHVLRHHLGLDEDVLRRAGDWTVRVPPLAQDRTVAILGMGELGSKAAEGLHALGFNVVGWARSAKSDAPVPVSFGEDGLQEVLATADILVLLLPLTPDTENLINAEALSGMKRGAVLINPGRGALIDDDALIAALDEGQIGHATLDVFRQEPLPERHPFWAHPKVTVTPHIASATRPSTASMVIAENIRRAEAGENLLYRVDRSTGY